jgi:hypothetical protein
MGQKANEMSKKIGTPPLTTAETDSESGDEGLSEKEKREKHRRALTIMRNKGLLSEEAYQKALNEQSTGDKTLN